MCKNPYDKISANDMTGSKTRTKISAGGADIPAAGMVTGGRKLMDIYRPQPEALSQWQGLKLETCVTGNVAQYSSGVSHQECV